MVSEVNGTSYQLSLKDMYIWDNQVEYSEIKKKANRTKQKVQHPVNGSTSIDLTNQ